MTIPSEKRKSGRPKGERDDVSAKLDRATVGRAKLVARFRNLSAAAYLSAILRPVVDRNYASMVADLDATNQAG